MPVQPAPVDPAMRQRKALIVFYVSALACAVAIGLAEPVHKAERALLFALAIVSAACAVWGLHRLLSAADELQKQINYRAVKFAFVGTLILSLVEGFLQSFGFPRVSAYAGPAVMVILWSIGLFISSWRYE